MVEKMSYEEMVTKACDSMKGKFMSRAMIKSFLTANFGWTMSPLAKVALKRTLAKFERKGDLSCLQGPEGQRQSSSQEGRSSS